MCQLLAETVAGVFVGGKRDEQGGEEPQGLHTAPDVIKEKFN